jgi:hypothetical protein
MSKQSQRNTLTRVYCLMLVIVVLYSTVRVCSSYEYEQKMKNAVLWDVAPCRSCVNRSFGGTYRLHLQGRKTSERGPSVSRWLAC